VFVGKTHTVELALGAVGLNPHWDTPRNPWDAAVARVPGGSSSGAGVSLWEGSALVALGSDTGGSIRIPASMTGTVGLRTTKGRWPTDGVVPLSPTLDTVGALTRTVEDALYVFAAVDPGGRDVSGIGDEGWGRGGPGPRVGVPRCELWDDCQGDIAEVIEDALDELVGEGWTRVEHDGSLLDEAGRLYLGGAIPGAECQAMLERDLPGWRELLHPIVGTRLSGAPTLDSSTYASAINRMRELAAMAVGLFDGCDVLALPTTVVTPPSIESVRDLDRYLVANRAALWPTSPASILGLCALSMPVGLDGAGMPVGLQLLARPGEEVRLLDIALDAERSLGTPLLRLGRPPVVGLS
jgi:aspartyl-tRNA(Asn)/glutamyl-tRNA(Gln) amidotransferase subunit A